MVLTPLRRQGRSPDQLLQPSCPGPHCPDLGRHWLEPAGGRQALSTGARWCELLSHTRSPPSRQHSPAPGWGGESPQVCSSHRRVPYGRGRQWPREPEEPLVGRPQPGKEWRHRGGLLSPDRALGWFLLSLHQRTSRKATYRK